MRVEGKEGTMRWLVSGTWDALCVSTSGGASFQVCDRKYVHGGNNIQVCGKIVSVSFECSNQRSGEGQEVSEQKQFPVNLSQPSWTRVRSFCWDITGQHISDWKKKNLQYFTLGALPPNTLTCLEN